MDIDDLEDFCGFRFSEKHRRALQNSVDPIHRKCELLCPDGNELESLVKVNQSMRAIDWKDWPKSCIAFATQGCGDYFCFVGEKENRIYYIEPIETVPESIEACEREGFVFPDFDTWYDYQLKDEESG